MSKPFSQACENNKAPILAVIREVFRPGDTVLELGSGTGQHACFFARKLPALRWQPSEMDASFAVLEAGLAGEELPNLLEPLRLDVRRLPWPLQKVQGVFSANTLHIMSWEAVADCFRGVAQVLAPGGMLCVYGPFKYGGEFTTASNARFDLWLQGRDPRSGVRDVEAVQVLAEAAGLELLADHALPANNQLLVWRKV